MNKISEKAVWDELVPSEDEKISPASFGQPAQAQMMFCYKCNQVIPANSAFCPWCQTELFVTCPKCGNKYSSQYPACNQCGTNREAYILEQKRLEAKRLEDERIRNERIKEQQRIEEEKKRERERLERIEQDKISIAQEQLRKQFQSEDQEIIDTPEFRKAKDFISKFEIYHKQDMDSVNFVSILAYVFLILGLFTMVTCTLFDNFSRVIMLMIICFVISFMCFAFASTFNKNKHDLKKQFRKYLETHSADEEIRPIVETTLSFIEGGDVVECDSLSNERKRILLILSYRKVYNKDYKYYKSAMKLTNY